MRLKESVFNTAARVILLKCVSDVTPLLDLLKLASMFHYSGFNSVAPSILLVLSNESELPTISLTLILESKMTQDSRLQKGVELPIFISNPEI